MSQPAWTIAEAEQHLAGSDPIMARLIQAYGPCRLFARDEAPFVQLIIAIINQLLSYQSADAIEGRLRALVGEITPDNMLATSDDALRAAGLSWSKIRYVNDISQRVKDGRMDFAALADMSDADIMHELTQVRGIGPWTAQMLLISGFKRPDVSAPGDVGLQRATRSLYAQRLEQVHAPWQPYRTVACWYLWQFVRNPDAYAAGANQA